MLLLPHVFQKVLEPTPTATDSDSSTAIIIPIPALSISTTAFHALPRAVLRSSGCAVCTPDKRKKLRIQASTTASPSIPEIACVNDSLFPAVAPAMPARFAFGTRSALIDSEAVEALAA